MNQLTRKPVIIHEDNHLLVIDKPPLLATMGAEAGEPTLVEWTKGWLKQKYDKPGNVYLGVVSRLDAFTTGLVVLAKTSKAAGRLTKQFQAGEVEKNYRAILESRPPNRQGTLIDWIRKDDKQRRMVVTGNNEAGSKRAELNYRLLGRKSGNEKSEQKPGRWLVDVELLTGRKHQIRVQFASRKAPILGDRKYSGKGEFEPGIALQSYSLSFEHPVQRVDMEFQIEAPKSWNLGRFDDK